MKRALLPVVCYLVIIIVLSACQTEMTFGNWYTPKGDLYSPTPVEGNFLDLEVSPLRLSDIDTAIDSTSRIHLIGTRGNGIYYLYLDKGIWRCIDDTKYDPENHNPSIPFDLSSSSVIQLNVDNENNPHIIWENEHNLFYVKWNGKEWVPLNSNQIFDSTNIETAMILSNDLFSNYHFTLDSTGNPHFVFYISYTDQDKNHIADIGYCKWDNNEFVCADNSIFLNEEDETFGSGLKTNSVNVSRDISISSFPSLALDVNNNPHIAWSQFIDFYDDSSEAIDSMSEIYYVYLSNNQWVCGDGSIYIPEGFPNNAEATSFRRHIINPTLKLDTNNKPYLVCLVDDCRPTMVAYTRWFDGSWSGISSNNNNDFIPGEFYIFSYKRFHNNVEFKLDTNNYPHFAWNNLVFKHDDETLQLLDIINDAYYIRWNGEKFVCLDGSEFDEKLFPNPANATRSGDIVEVCMELDSDNNPCITFLGYNKHQCIKGIIAE
jgi:hypothetical protein